MLNLPLVEYDPISKECIHEWWGWTFISKNTSPTNLSQYYFRSLPVSQQFKDIFVKYYEHILHWFVIVHDNFFRYLYCINMLLVLSKSLVSEELRQGWAKCMAVVLISCIDPLRLWWCQTHYPGAQDQCNSWVITVPFTGFPRYPFIDQHAKTNGLGQNSNWGPLTSHASH